MLNPSQGYSWEVHFQLLGLEFVEKQLWPVLKFMDGDEEVFKHALNLAKYLTTPEMPSSDDTKGTISPQLHKSNNISKQRFVELDLSIVIFEHMFNMIDKIDDDALSPEVELCVLNCLKLFHNLMWTSEDTVRNEVVTSVTMCLLKHGLVRFIDHSIQSTSKGEHFGAVSQLLHDLLKSDPGLKKALLPSFWTKEGDTIVNKNESCMGSTGSAASDCSEAEEAPTDDRNQLALRDSSGSKILMENPLTLDNWVFKASGTGENFSKASSHLGKRHVTDLTWNQCDATSSKLWKPSADGFKMEYEYVRETLKDFVTSFMKSGFSSLVETFLKSLTDRTKRLQFQELEMYFTLLEDFVPFYSLTSWNNMEPAFCIDTFSFMLYDGVSLSEEIILREKEGRDSNELHQRCLRCVLLWQKMVKCLSSFMENTEDKPQIIQKIENLRQLEQIWQFFVFMMRSYNAAGAINNAQSINFFKSLVVTNHRLLLLLEDKDSFQLQPVVEQFAQVDIMDKFTLLLQEFATNGSFVNNCLFTMMHHIAGDCEKLDLLVKPKTLNTLVQITEHELPLAEVFEDLIDFVFDRFINLIEGNPNDCVTILSEEDSTEHGKKESIQDDCPPPWTELENTYLCLHYLENFNDSNLLQTIQSKLATVNISKSQKQILKQLFYVGLLEDNEFKKFEATFVTETDVKKAEVKFSDMENAESIETCLKKISEKDGLPMIQWLQKFLLEACYVKLGGRDSHSKEEIKRYEEPVPHVSLLLQEMVPLVPFTCDQEKMLSNQYFHKLLEELNFVMPQESKMVYPRIPHSWMAKDLYEKALLLAGNDESALPEMKFSNEDLQNAKNGFTEISSMNFFD
ncbi:protein timeless-like isoform X2 [Lineus longissimus]